MRAGLEARAGGQGSADGTAESRQPGRYVGPGAAGLSPPVIRRAVVRGATLARSDCRARPGSPAGPLGSVHSRNTGLIRVNGVCGASAGTRRMLAGIRRVAASRPVIILTHAGLPRIPALRRPATR